MPQNSFVNVSGLIYASHPSVDKPTGSCVWVLRFHAIAKLSFGLVGLKSARNAAQWMWFPILDFEQAPFQIRPWK